ncbi:MAG TPA: 16S rRNA (cytidine(1402)-2'-O)-methyltransferase [Gemmatimonadota bacterium]|nr:16S rRNA (cytidine(1402)-2'-O)-methyltransferase [Gemmatimonadota bacterium]
MSAGGTLYLVGTPIGHREDMTGRARKVLEEVPLVACEDTRTCRKLFAWLGLPAPEMIVYEDRSAGKALPRVLERIEAGESVALVSEAGMPAIQDPGYRLVAEARRRGVEVVPVPGPTALIAALAASGLPTDRFVFLGFAPRRGRQAWWRETLGRTETVVVYESPGRVPETLAAIAAVDADRPVVLARELTKIHEEFVTGTAAEVGAEIGARADPLKGECVIVVGGGSAAGGDAVPWRDAVARLCDLELGRSLSRRDLVEILAAIYPGQRNAIYAAVQAAGHGVAR